MEGGFYFLDPCEKAGHTTFKPFCFSFAYHFKWYMKFALHDTEGFALPESIRRDDQFHLSFVDARW